MLQSKTKGKRVIVVKIMMPPKNIEVQVPAHWKVNKLKCLIIKKIPVLKFDDFQLFSLQKGQTLKGQETLSLYGQKILKLGVIQKHEKEFKNYYCQSVKNLLYSIYSEQVQQEGMQLMSKMPLLNKNFQKAHLLYAGYSYQQALVAGQGPQENMNEQQEQQNQFRILHFLWVLSIPFFLHLVTTYLSWQKTLVLLIVVSLYLFMHFHVIRNADRREERDDPPQQQPRQPINHQQSRQQQQMSQQEKQSAISSNKQQKIENNHMEQHFQDHAKPNHFKAICLHLLFFMIQAGYCFVCSLFPNWTVDVHLIANRQYLNKMQNAIMKLDPEYQFKQINVR